MDNKNKKVPNFWDHGPMVVTGCTKVSPGCKNCWSEKAHGMRKNNDVVSHIYSPELMTDGKFNGKVQFNLHLLERAIKRAKPGQVIALWNDLYHEDITLEQITDAHCLMGYVPHLTFLMITKRPERAAEYVNGVIDAVGLDEHVPDHMWHIATTENQAMADKRIPHLLKIPGKRGIIIEPMLEAIVVKPEPVTPFNGLPHIHQVICGPENGPGKRPFDAAWADSINKQCEAAGVPFYRKDTGEGTLAWRTS